MTKEEIEKEVLEMYRHYCYIINNFEKGLNQGVQEYINNHPDWIKNSDFRPGTLMRLLSCAISVRYTLERSQEYIKQENWNSKFLESYQPDFAKDRPYLGFFKDIDMMNRFYIFHGFFHQFETTLRIVMELLDIKGRKHPMFLVNDELDFYDNKFFECISAVRNTIHNNGFYRPIGQQPDEFTYDHKEFTIVFVKDGGVDLNMGKTLILMEDLLEATYHLLNHERVLALTITIDRG